MRSSVVQDYLQLLLQKEKGEPLLIVQIPSWPFKQNKNVLSSTIHSSLHVSLSDLDIQYGELDLDPEVEKVKVLTQCYSSIEVSSNVADIFKMTNGETSSFWQSDGSARSHWIRYGHPVLKYNIAADCHTCWSTSLNMLDNTEVMLRPACSLCCPQIKDETWCGSATSCHCRGLQWPQLHASAGVGVCGKKSPLYAGDPRYSHPQQCHRLCSSIGQCQHHTPLWVTSCQSFYLVECAFVQGFHFSLVRQSLIGCEDNIVVVSKFHTWTVEGQLSCC